MLKIFDKDWTICQSADGSKYINAPGNQVLMPGVAEKCAALRAAGHTLAVASNQGGVAYKKMTYQQAEEIVAHAAGLIGAELFLFCPHHPKGSHELYARECYCRKPQPGMLIDTMEIMGAKKAVFIGDRAED